MRIQETMTGGGIAEGNRTHTRVIDVPDGTILSPDQIQVDAKKTPLSDWVEVKETTK